MVPACYAGKSGQTSQCNPFLGQPRKTPVEENLNIGQDVRQYTGLYIWFGRRYGQTCDCHWFVCYSQWISGMVRDLEGT